jgi:hypothetical protein
MARLITLFDLLAAVSSLLAAVFWYWASQVEGPPSALVGSSGWDGIAPSGLGPNTAVDASPLVKFVKESGRRNKVAALCSAAAALFACLSWGLGLFSPT